MAAPDFPIVLIRGFAASDANIEEAANQAFLGYEQGSTKTRQNAAGEIRPYFFESVVVRLMKDHGYDPAYRENLLGYQSEQAVPHKSIWLHRYYDLASKTFDGQRLPIEDYAADLRRLILAIRDKVCVDKTGAPDPVAFAAFKVHLVAHSQGGLVARSYLQKICRKAPYLNDPTLKFAGGKDPLVASLFTYGTPHNGIELLGQNVPDLGPLSLLQARNFNRKAIREYLGLTKPGDDSHDLDGALDPARTFCIVGTNWKDYDQVSKALTRELSDGLVMCKNAYMVDNSTGKTRHSARAYVSRAHGGPFGMVNSEEGYQNLRRFLFGDWRVDVEVKLEGLRLPDNLVAAVKKARKPAEGNYVLDVIASVRGQQVKLHERRNETSSGVRFPVRYAPGQADTLFQLSEKPGGPDPQHTVCSLFLISELSTETKVGKPGPMEFAIQFTLEKPIFEVGGFLWLKEHIEGLATLREAYRIRIDPKHGLFYAKIQDQALEVPDLALAAMVGSAAAGDVSGHIPFGPADDASLKPGEARGKILVHAWKRKLLD